MTTLYVAVLALAIGLIPVVLDKWRALHKPGLTPQRARRRS